MFDIKLDTNGDLLFDNNDVEAIINENEAINQQLYITLQTALGEFQPDDSLGVRQDNMFGKHIIKDFLKKDITDAIEDQVPKIDSVYGIDIEIDYEHRIMNISLKYTTINQSEGDFSNQIRIGGD